MYAKQVGSFYAGALHPFSVPAHILILIALGVWFGFGGRLKKGIGYFLSGLFLALLLSLFIPVMVPEAIMLLFVMMLGGLLALNREIPEKFFLLFILSLGFLLGFDSAPEESLSIQTVLEVLGTFLSIAIIVCDLAFIRSLFKREGMVIAGRILGSWIAACALMVLALSFR